MDEETQQAEEPKLFKPDSTPIPAGPLKGLPAWVRDLRTMFLGYGRQISELTAFKAELEYEIANIGQDIILYFPEEVGRGGPDGNETVLGCGARLIKEYALLRDQFEPMAARLAAAEKELEQLKKERQDGISSSSDPGDVQKKRGKGKVPAK